MIVVVEQEDGHQIANLDVPGDSEAMVIVGNEESDVSNVGRHAKNAC